MSIDWKLKKTLNSMLLNVITEWVLNQFLCGCFGEKKGKYSFFLSMGVLNVTYDASRFQILPS